MRVAVKLKPDPRVPDGLEHAGEIIRAVKVVDDRYCRLITDEGTVDGHKDFVLPGALKQYLFHVFATKTLGPTPRKFHEDFPGQQDETYDPDSIAPDDMKPEPRGRLHPKEFDALQTFHKQLPILTVEDEVDELSITMEQDEVEEEFPQDLPSYHPKERALRKQLGLTASFEVQALGEETVGFDINQARKAFDMLEKAWDPPDMFGNRSYMSPGMYIKKITPKISKATDFSRGMNAVCKHWIKNHPPEPREPDPRHLEDDDGTMMDMYRQETEWWKQNKRKVLSYYKGWKFPPRAEKLVDKIVAAAIKFAKGKGIDEQKYIKLVASRWAMDCEKHSSLQDMVGNLQGALISSKNILGKKTGKDFAREIQRRQRLSLSLRDKRSFKYKQQLQDMGGLWDGRHKEWLLPDQGSLDKAREMIGIQASVREALPIHTGPLTKKFMREITDELKKDVGFFPTTALNTPRYLRLLTFTRKPEAAAAAKKAAAKGFPASTVVKVYITKPDGQKKQVYAIANVTTDRLQSGGLLLTKEGYQKLMKKKTAD
jgi:hypothetical protein